MKSKEMAAIKIARYLNNPDSDPAVKAAIMGIIELTPEQKKKFKELFTFYE